ncbi:hypothetical protein DVH24_026142 [Malus domestica]|uniref:Uncharacterized protein n=1 Tax=Malus domestica TaxID=3750 RepID=A0A498KHX5_MALDO|nr:hypothetical protein DVH24_026142 [Malus domestica]
MSEVTNTAPAYWMLQFSDRQMVDVASSLEVLFLHPGVVFLTGGDAQGLVKRDTNHVVGIPQVAELGDLLKEATDKAV